MTNHFDDKDKRILAALQKSARDSIRTIAMSCGLRPSTVHQRIKRMEESGIIKGYTVVVDKEKTGQPLVVFMLVSGIGGRYLDNKFLRSPELEEVHGITGEYDLLFKLRFKDLRAFNKFIIGFREKYKGAVTKTITMVQTTALKE